MTQRTPDVSAARPSLWERTGAFLFAWRNLVFPLVLLALLGGTRPVFSLGDPRADRWFDALGLAVAVAGQSLRAAVIGYAYIHRGGKDRKVYAEHLVTEGFFKHSRNPLYLGNLLVLTGLFIIHNNFWALLLGLLWFLLAYSAIIAAEEAYLARRFGAEYLEYCRRVPRWLPNFRGLRRSLEGMKFDWIRVIVKEYSSTFTWIASALGLLAYEAMLEPPYPGRTRYLLSLGAIFAVAAVLWGWARHYKKTDVIRAQRAAARARPE